MHHPFWGEVEESWAGLVAEHPVVVPGFEEPAEVFLGEELDEEDKEYAPARAQLDAYAATFQAFMAQVPEHVAALQAQAFARYQQLYAHWYEDPAKSGEPALGLTTAAAHAVYLREVKYIRVTDEQTLRLVMGYKLDPEHGLEAKFVANTLVDMSGIADT